MITQFVFIICLLNVSWHQKIDAMENETTVTAGQALEIMQRNSYEKSSWYQMAEKIFPPLPEQNKAVLNEEEYIEIHVCSEESNTDKNGSIYLGNNGDIKNAAFYGRQNINILADYLNTKIQENPDKKVSFIIEGKSIGASIIVTTLNELILCQNNSNSVINNITQKEAENILEAVNKGKILLSVPVLSMQHICAVVFCSKLAGDLTALSICALFLAYNKSLFLGWIKNEPKDKSICILGLFIAIITMHHIWSYRLENMYKTLINRYIIPRLTEYTYNPFSTTPLEAAKNIRSSVTCPILIHCSKHDGFLLNPNKDTVDFFKNLKEFNGKTFHTWLLLSNDDTHDTNNKTYNTVKNDLLTPSLIEFSHKSRLETLPYNNYEEWINNIHTTELEKISNYHPSRFDLGRSVYQSLHRLKGKS